MIEAICKNKLCEKVDNDMSDNCGDSEIFSVIDCKDAICPPGLNICYAEDCPHFDQLSDDNCLNEVVSDVSQCRDWVRDWVREPDENGCWNCKHDVLKADALCRQGGAESCNVPELEFWEPIEPKEKEIILQCSNCKWRDVRDSPCMEDNAPNCIQPDVSLWEPIEPAPTPWATYEDQIKTEIGKGPFKNQVGGSHYRDSFPFCQPAEFFARNNIPFTEACVCKYVLRYKLKGGIEDLKKAKHYLEMLAWVGYEEKI